MEFLVEFELDIPDSVPNSEVEDRERAEAAAADELADHGHLVRLWRTFLSTGPVTILGLYRADSKAELNELLGALPLYEWMHTSITPLLQHPNDPGERERASK
jgi:muconolactone D-isomerase